WLVGPLRAAHTWSPAAAVVIGHGHGGAEDSANGLDFDAEHLLRQRVIKVEGGWRGGGRGRWRVLDRNRARALGGIGDRAGTRTRRPWTLGIRLPIRCGAGHDSVPFPGPPGRMSVFPVHEWEQVGQAVSKCVRNLIPWR